MSYSEEQRILAIDLGSNAMRASVACFDPAKDLEIIESMRYPLRLGHDVFSEGKLTKDSFKRAQEAFSNLKDLMHEHDVTEVKAVATSALRDSQNGDDFVDYIQKKTGITIDVIQGDQEASLIKAAVGSVIDLSEKLAILIDIGGGSTEITVTDNDEIVFSQSYQCGTVRILEKIQTKKVDQLITDTVKQAYKAIKKIIGNREIDICVGTGGNLKRMGKLRHLFFNRSAHKVTMHELSAINHEVSKLNLQQRINFLDMRADRADVIVPAMQIVQLILVKFDIREILLPPVGLKEGVMIDHFGETPRNIITN